MPTHARSICLRTRSKVAASLLYPAKKAGKIRRFSMLPTEVSGSAKPNQSLRSRASDLKLSSHPSCHVFGGFLADSEPFTQLGAWIAGGASRAGSGVLAGGMPLARTIAQ